ncbi:hypothetical protein ACFSTC_40415 [Nonomuraea ferruginea]
MRQLSGRWPPRHPHDVRGHPRGRHPGGVVTEGVDTNRIRGVHFVPLAELPGLGFGSRFVELAQAGWPGAGSYMGDKANIGL